MSPEYEYYKADNDTEPDFSNIGFAYIPVNAFSVDEYNAVKGNIYEKGMEMDQLILIAETDDINEIRKLAGEKLSGSFVSVLAREDIQGIKMLDDEIKQHEMFAYVFPAIFVVIALMIIITTMSRIINESRMQIGTMKALGVKKRKIMMQYLYFSFLLSFTGCLCGLIGGPTLFGSLMGKFMALTFTMPEWSCGYSASFYVVSAALVVICVLAAYMSCRRIINMPTRDILYPRAPKKVKKCIFERMPFWDKLKFSLQYNLRDMTRNKVRNGTVLVGIVGSMLLTASALGCLDTLDNMKKWNFDKIQQFEYQLTFRSEAELAEKESVRDDLDGELVMISGIELKSSDTSEKSYNANVTVTEGKGLYNITDEDTKVYELSDGEVSLTSVLADKAGLKKGDSFMWKKYGDDKWTESKVGSISRSIGVQGISMLRTTYEAGGGEFDPFVCVTDEDAGERSYDSVTDIASKEDLEESWDNGLQMYYVIILSFVIMTLAILFIVIYNSAILSFNERQKEFATLKVCGIKKGVLRKIMTAQNMWMTMIGCIVGMPFGRIVLNYMFTSGGDSQDFAVVIYLRSYLISFAAVVVCSYLINLLFTRTLRKLNMAECMKANE
jgi:putative ABC transport system permease protein